MIQQDKLQKRFVALPVCRFLQHCLICWKLEQFFFCADPQSQHFNELKVNFEKANTTHWLFVFLRSL